MRLATAGLLVATHLVAGGIGLVAGGRVGFEEGYLLGEATTQVTFGAVAVRPLQSLRASACASNADGFEYLVTSGAAGSYRLRRAGDFHFAPPEAEIDLGPALETMAHYRTEHPYQSGISVVDRAVEEELALFRDGGN